jgi:hypothetical protein
MHDKKSIINNSEKCPPRADTMIHSLRSFGYNISESIADIIDNSVSAKAENIWILQNWNGNESWIAILDDGNGMNESELKEAMRMGTKSLDEREDDDLGRFGFGLKTASFAQCDKLTVRSKQNTSIATRCWDLDIVKLEKEWILLKDAYPETEHALQFLNDFSSGTIVIWEKLTRMMNNFESMNDSEQQNTFNKKLEEIENYIAMVFHRYLDIGGRLNIFITNTSDFDNPRKIKPWDPFLRKKKSKELPDMFIDDGKIKLKGYILPHHSKLQPLDFNEAAKPLGSWNEHQGFYVYRQNRMISAGTWLNTGHEKLDHFRLARISIEINNSNDTEWKIDVTKSEIIPPPYLVRQLHTYADKVRRDAKKIYMFRGKSHLQGNTRANYLIWKQKTFREKKKYVIEKKHPLIKEMIKNLGKKSPQLTKLLKLIEDTIPTKLISINHSTDPSIHDYDENINDYHYIDPIEIFKKTIINLMDNNLTKEEAVKMAINTEPFDRIPEIIMYADEINE